MLVPTAAVAQLLADCWPGSEDLQRGGCRGSSDYAITLSAGEANVFVHGLPYLRVPSSGRLDDAEMQRLPSTTFTSNAAFQQRVGRASAQVVHCSVVFTFGQPVFAMDAAGAEEQGLVLLPHSVIQARAHAH